MAVIKENFLSLYQPDFELKENIFRYREIIKNTNCKKNYDGYYKLLTDINRYKLMQKNTFNRIVAELIYNKTMHLRKESLELIGRHLKYNHSITVDNIIANQKLVAIILRTIRKHGNVITGVEKLRNEYEDALLLLWKALEQDGRIFYQVLSQSNMNDLSCMLKGKFPKFYQHDNMPNMAPSSGTMYLMVKIFEYGIISPKNFSKSSRVRLFHQIHSMSLDGSMYTLYEKLLAMLLYDDKYLQQQYRYSYAIRNGIIHNLPQVSLIIEMAKQDRQAITSEKTERLCYIVLELLLPKYNLVPLDCDKYKQIKTKYPSYGTYAQDVSICVDGITFFYPPEKCRGFNSKISKVAKNAINKRNTLS